MYFKFIKFVVILSLLVCCGFAGRVLHSRFFNLVVQGKDPRHRGILQLSQTKNDKIDTLLKTKIPKIVPCLAAHPH